MYDDLAVKLLTHSTASMAPFSEEEARKLVQYMHPYTIPAGEWFIVEDERSDNDFMMLILTGEVVVESSIAEGQTLTVTVLNPGQWVGELGILDGNPRQAACRASDDADVICAIISRTEMMQLLDAEPRLFGKLAFLLASNVAGYLRNMHQRMCRYAEIQNAIRTTL
ncbi:MAG: cyclic nucleotide-binding domain-containing protein [Brachymonas sp.]|nr:cyclic nucleotide-binding domain-containing protein [Brachymonas sp.]